VKVRRFFQYDFTVKVDPDSVFFPVRLKHLLARKVGDGRIVFLENSHDFPKMLGPIEVISRGALYRFMYKHEECTHKNRDLIHITGEDASWLLASARC